MIGGGDPRFGNTLSRIYRPRVEGRDHLGMQWTCGCNRSHAAHRVAAKIIRDLAAGTFDHRDQGCHIPDTHSCINHDIGVTGGNQKISVAIAPGAEQFDSPGQGVEGGSVPVPGNVNGLVVSKVA